MERDRFSWKSPSVLLPYCLSVITVKILLFDDGEVSPFCFFFFSSSRGPSKLILSDLFFSNWRDEEKKNTEENEQRIAGISR